MTVINKENSKVFLLILLGMLSAFGPFVTDMYLPSLPAMADYFSTNSSMVQLGLTTSMVGLSNILISTGVTFAVCAVCSLLCALWAIRRPTQKVAVCGI